MRLEINWNRLVGKIARLSRLSGLEIEIPAGLTQQLALVVVKLFPDHGKISIESVESRMNLGETAVFVEIVTDVLGPVAGRAGKGEIGDDDFSRL